MEIHLKKKAPVEKGFGINILIKVGVNNPLFSTSYSNSLGKILKPWGGTKFKEEKKKLKAPFLYGSFFWGWEQ